MKKLILDIDSSVMDIGARVIRRRLADGGDVSDLLDDAVAEYVRSDALYGT